MDVARSCDDACPEPWSAVARFGGLGNVVGNSVLNSEARMSAARPIVITVAQRGTGVLITLQGTLDVAAGQAIDETVRRVATSRGVAAIQIDVTRVTSIDAAGMRCLLQARRTVHGQDLKFTLAASGPVLGLIALPMHDVWFAGSRVV